MGAIHSTKIPTSPTGKSGPPQKVDPFFRNFSGWTEPIHWVLDRNFRKFWLNGSRPMALVSTYCFFCRSRCRRRRRPRCLSSLLKTMRIQNLGSNVKMGNFEKFHCSKKSILSLFVSGCSNSWPSRRTTEWQTGQETEKVVSATRKTL